MDMSGNVPCGVLLQVYGPSIDPNGVLGLSDHLDWIKWMDFGGVVSQPNSRWRRSSRDWVYSPVDHMTVDSEIGEDRLVAMHRAFDELDVLKVGDLVCNRADQQSELVQRVFSDPERWASWFRVTSDPAVWSGWNTKTNIFGLDPRLNEPTIRRQRASTFYPDQWEFNVGNLEVLDYLSSVGMRMIRDWGYDGLRLDAVGHLAAKRLETPTGHHEPAGLAFVEALRRRLASVQTWKGRQPVLIAEAGGPSREMAAWLLSGRCDLAYDFAWVVAVLMSLTVGDWIPLRQYWAELPPVAGEWLRFLGSHDERQLRYSLDIEQLKARHGGDNGEFVCFGGHGLTLPFRNFVPNERAFVLAAGLTILSKGVPLLYQNDVGGYRGDTTVKMSEPRVPNRCLYPWDSDLPRAGWPEDAPFPLEPEWGERSVKQQMADPHSVMAQVRRLIAVRNRFPSAQRGDQVEIPTGSTKVEAFARTHEEERTLLVMAHARDGGIIAHPDVSPWAGKRARRLLLSEGYEPDSPVLRWDSHVEEFGHGEHPIALGPYELAVFEVLS